MEKNYRIYSANGSIYGYDSLKRGRELSVAIMDTKDLNDLQGTLDWYHANLNRDLIVITYESRFAEMENPARYKDVTYIIFKTPPELGERINAVSAECASSYFMIVRTDAITILDMLNLESIAQRFKRDDTLTVQTPLIFNKHREFVPTVKEPVYEDKIIDCRASMPQGEDERNICPFLGLGIYNRKNFQRLRGYDTEIKSAYWQTLEFGIRAHLYGYKILSVIDIAMMFPLRGSLMEDSTECKGIERLYTRALCVQIGRNGQARVRKAYRTDKRLLSEEVKSRASLYKTDYSTLVALWRK